MFISNLKLKQDSWFYSHPGHHSAGGISRRFIWHLPQVFACFLFPTINFSLLYRGFIMTEYEFFTEREERWGDNFRLLCSINHCYRGTPSPIVQLCIKLCWGSQPAVTCPASIRGCCSVFFGFHCLQLASGMHWGSPYKAVQACQFPHSYFQLAGFTPLANNAKIQIQILTVSS